MKQQNTIKLTEKLNIELDTPNAFELIPKIEGTKGILRINAVTATMVRVTYNDKIHNAETIKALVTAKNKLIKESKINEICYITNDSKNKYLIFDDSTKKASFTENMSLAKQFNSEEEAKTFKKSLDEAKTLGYAKTYIINRADIIKEKTVFITNLKEFKRINENKINESDYLRNFGNAKKPIIIETTVENALVLQSLITAPYVKVDTGQLGNSDLYVLVSLDSKADWTYGYLENSDYFRLMLSNTGELEQFSGGMKRKYGITFRKTKVKTLEEAALKINNYITSLNTAKNNTSNVNEAQTEDIFKSKLFTFLDYPWDMENEEKIITKISKSRNKFTTASENTIKSYLQNVYDLNVENIKNECSKKFIYDYQQLL
jgi:hypothetical protein